MSLHRICQPPDSARMAVRGRTYLAHQRGVYPASLVRPLRGKGETGVEGVAGGRQTERRTASFQALRQCAPSRMVVMRKRAHLEGERRAGPRRTASKRNL